MADKTEISYKAVLSEVKKLLPRAQIKTIMSDFEMALRNACRFTFPQAHSTGCNFHFDQVSSTYISICNFSQQNVSHLK